MSLNDVKCSLMSLELLAGSATDENENKVAKSESQEYDSFEMLKKKRKSR